MGSEVINLQTYYVKKTDITDDLTTDDAVKPLSAKQGKKLQDTKLNKSQGLENANKNIITDSNGDITVGELNVNDDSLIEAIDYLTNELIKPLSVVGYGGKNYYPNVGSDLVLTITSDYSNEELGDLKIYVNNGLVTDTASKGNYTISEGSMMQLGGHSNVIVTVQSSVMNLQATVELAYNSN